MRSITRFWLALCFVIVGLAPGATPVQAQNQPICFPNIPGIADCISGDFQRFWSQNGGLPVFGYPRGPIEQATPAGASEPLATQWFERARLEIHPENSPEYRVLMGRMGVERLAQLGRDWQTEPREAGPQAGCRWFPETGFNVCNQADGAGFLQYWQSNGLAIGGLDNYQRSLALFGYPISSTRPEVNAEGVTVLTQWFERARFEWHPNNPAQFRVLLGLLGNELRAGTPPPAPSVTNTTPVFGVEVWRRNVPEMSPFIFELGPMPVRYNGLFWSQVEPERGNRDWTGASRTDNDLRAIATAGGTPILVIRSAPTWARLIPEKACSPVRGRG